jgi:hypothetical protein
MQYVRFEVPTMRTMKVTAFWNEMPCSLIIYIYTDVSEELAASNFKVSGEYIASIFNVPSTLNMEVARSSETLVNIYQTARHHIS